MVRVAVGRKREVDMNKLLFKTEMTSNGKKVLRLQAHTDWYHSARAEHYRVYINLHHNIAACSLPDDMGRHLLAEGRISTSAFMYVMSEGTL